MSQQGNFVGGFLLGTVVGGIVGGITGVLVASRISQTGTANEEGAMTKIDNKLEAKASRKRQLRAATEQNMEVARRGLEDKIAQLNEAIDDVRQQLGTVNGNGESGEQSTARKG
jgi:gas vesicle protein